MNDVKAVGQRLTENIQRVILGKANEVRLVLVALLCEGHILVEDVPGVGKTMLSRAVARSLGCTFARVQCTPDLLPSDLIGVSVFNQKSQEFEFRPGPLHHQILLTDEINRATPKTQSALLEAMEERQVSVEGRIRPLPRPFLVLATQNPIEYEGTFPLPEAQLDRFLLRLKLGYPSFEAENDMLIKQRAGHPIEELPQVVTSEELTAMQARARKVHVDDSLREYIVQLVQRTREQERLYLGASPRGSLALYRAAQAHAALEGRDYVIGDDVQALVLPTLGHRMLGRDGAGGRQVEDVLRSLLEQVRVPV